MTTVPAPPGAPTEALLTQRLLDTLQPVQLEVLDESWQHSGHVGANDSGQGTHFRVRISAEAFRGKSPVARHRLVYDALQDFLDQGLHALAIEASLPPA
ncbi:MAG: BolA family transcriptional regulator [Betaproteobacteria bacterium]|jgi:BolA protein|nr:BolA family transcriptional regulator [Betaproteobacteria bacterium]